MNFCDMGIILSKCWLIFIANFQINRKTTEILLIKIHYKPKYSVANIVSYSFLYKWIQIF